MNSFNLPDLKHVKMQAFWNGFWQGLSGSWICEPEWPKIEVPPEWIAPLRNRIISPTDAMRSDWEQVGNDLRTAVHQYDKQISQ